MQNLLQHPELCLFFFLLQHQSLRDTTSYAVQYLKPRRNHKTQWVIWLYKAPRFSIKVHSSQASQDSTVAGKWLNALAPNLILCKSRVLPYTLGKPLYIKAFKCNYFILQLLICLSRILQGGQSFNLFFVNGILLFGHLFHSLENIFCRFGSLYIKEGGEKKQQTVLQKDLWKQKMNHNTLCTAPRFASCLPIIYRFGLGLNHFPSGPFQSLSFYYLIGNYLPFRSCIKYKTKSTWEDPVPCRNRS